MKLHTTPEQTAKLIELGFDNLNAKLKTQVLGINGTQEETLIIRNDYSIGEMIEWLPNDGVMDRRLEFDGFYWYVDWDSFDKIRQTMAVELVDALYDMVVKLKEEGVI